MTLITLTDPKQSHVKIAIDENDYTNLARYRALGYFDADEETVETKDEAETVADDKETDDTNEADELVDADEETVETKDEAETVADDKEKPKPRRRRRTVEK